MIGRASRSLKASPEGLNRANKAVLSFATKLDLAAEAEISRTTVQKFFAGKPIERENFHRICQRLDLPWLEIVELPKPKALEERAPDSSLEITALVQAVREQGHASIQQRCGMMRVLDMSQPMELNDIYTNVNILEKISGRRRLEIIDLLKEYSVDESDRLSLGRVTQEQVSGLMAVQRYSKLMVLGKPGAGKTVFLKYVALQCSLGKLLAERVPIFISLKDFAETEQQPSLLEYISGQLLTYGVTDTQVATRLLNQGKMLILLDGLDEVREIDNSRVLQEVRRLVAHHANQFVITCRIAAQEYTFEQFTEVEIADFDQAQIAAFATKWFVTKEPSKGHKFLQELQANRSIQELADCPLLLTLLCLVFEESNDFPTSRSELYQEGLDILLKKWDLKRNIKREQVYKQLSVQHKQDLLSQIARVTFEQGDYFFKQQELERYIVDYLRNFPWARAEPELYLDSQAVLKSLEAQQGLLVERARGVYSFSHLTFQEYFTARAIVAGGNPQVLETSLKQLVSSVTENRWREVFLLSVEMLPNGNYLLQLMKQQIDQLVAQDSCLQAFLTWVNQKVESVTAPYKPAVVRAFYLDLELTRALSLARSLPLARTLDHTLTRNLARPLALDLSLDRALTLNCILMHVSDPAKVARSVLERALTHAHALDSQLEQSLQQLKGQLPELDQDTEKFKAWWQAEGQAWTKQLNATAIKYRNLGRNWQWNGQQQKALQQYYATNQLLIKCINNSFYVTRTVRDEIEFTLLLPTTELEQAKQV